MGLTSKAFLRMHHIETKPVQKTTPNLRACSHFGGLIRKHGTATELPARVKKASMGDLGTVAKAKDAKGHGSEKRGGGSGSGAKPLDQVGAMMDYENGTLDREGTIKLFQNLVDTGLAWQLQGSYGRAAKQMLDAGLITLPEKRGTDTYGNVTPSRQDKEAGNEVARASKLGKTAGESMHFLGALQSLVKAKDAKGHGSEKRGETYAEAMNRHMRTPAEHKPKPSADNSAMTTPWPGHPGAFAPTAEFPDGSRVKGVPATNTGDDWETRRGVKGKHPESEEYQNALRDEASELRRGITGEDNNPKDDAIRSKIQSLKSKMVRSTKNDYGAIHGD